MIEPEFKFHEKYRVPSNRLKEYDYSSDGAYFITICTKNRENYFGEVADGTMVLNEMGQIVQNEISDIKNHFQNVLVDKFIVMPNHVHVILMLQNNDFDNEMTHCRDVSEKHLYGQYSYDERDKFTKQYYSGISPKRWTIGNIIKLFKWFANKKINALDQIFFAWQPNYHDRIIRDENELNRIRQYIVDNPFQWEFDEDYRE